MDFESDPQRVLAEIVDQGQRLTATERAALAATDPTFWKRVAGGVDPRLQKARLRFD